MANLKATVFPTVGSGVMLGSITGIVKNHILSKLPKGFIKYTYIKNSIPSVTEQMNNEEANLVKERPTLSIGLNYSFNNDAASQGDQFQWGMSKIPVGVYMYDSIYTKIFYNEQDCIYLSTIDERTKLVYDVAIRLDSETQAYNLMNYMRAYIGVGRPYYLSRVNIETPIPFECLIMISAGKGFDLKSPVGRQAFHEYLSKWSGGRVTYKRNLSSGNYNYFLLYNANILCKIPDAPTIEKNMEGKSVINTDMRLQLEVEFPTFTNFITEREELSPVDDGMKDMVDDSSTAVIYNFTSQMPVMRMLGEKTLVSHFEVVTGLNETVDETSFEEALQPRIMFFIQHQKQYLGADPDAIKRHIKISVIRDTELLVEDLDYEVDWGGYTVRILNPMLNYVYRFAFYIDLVKYNQIMEVHDSLGLRQYEQVNKVKEIL
jgi:hypothetical protein